ncbi:MBL fold metallo-hydrolase [Streptomyces sp. NPDC088812]|uniref:MBL fold metallo-hydrolase n=1 Tax=Streptomyces sp. NPDC088812 TaxID=3365905 RepID=UPI0038168C21
MRQVDALPEPSRRKVLKAVGAGVATGGLLAAGGGGQAVAATAAAASSSASRHRTRIVLLGTGGGPALLGGERYGASTAIVHDGRVYVVDLGVGAFLRLAQSGLAPKTGLGSTLSTVQGIFFTHLHSDHFTDWPTVYSTGAMNIVGRTLPAIRVFGPGDRGSLTRVFPDDRTAPAVFNPDDPTPGIAGMTAHLRKAFAQDLNDRARDSNATSPDTLFDVQDIPIGDLWTVDAQGRPPRLNAPIEVWTDGDVRVTATLVDHHPTAPAFAFRFDTPDGSVVVSGDTAVSENLIDLARDCDYLVHEVIDPQFVDRLTAALPAGTAEALKEHLLAAHTTIEQVGRDVAQPAGAKNLVLNHLVPANNALSRWRLAQRGYSGRLIVGEDLMQLGVGTVLGRD